MRRVGWLRNAAALRGCSASLISQLYKNSTRRSFAFGEEVVRQGDRSNQLYLVCESGQLGAEWLCSGCDAAADLSRTCERDHDRIIIINM